MLFGGGVGAGGGMKHVTQATVGDTCGSPTAGTVGGLGGGGGPRSGRGVTGAGGGSVGGVATGTVGNETKVMGVGGGPLMPVIGLPTPVRPPPKTGALPCNGPSPSSERFGGNDDRIAVFC